MKLTFLGGTGTVTGSKYLLEHRDRKLLIDCGLFQGLKDLRLRNWKSLNVAPTKIDAVIITHAHLDHSGYLPLLVKNGFGGQIYMTEATKDLCEILLRDSAFLQEKDAEYANRKGFSKHHPAKPLYTKADAEAALQRIRTVEFNTPFEATSGMQVTFGVAGHILGASTVAVQTAGTSIQFSGDLGRLNDPVMPDPALASDSDYIVMESTYGNRSHPSFDIEKELARIVIETARKGGHVIVPAFAVGRTQSLLYYLERLKRTSQIPNVPVFLDSPMAINASKLYCKHSHFHKLTDQECARACGVARYTRETEESKELAHLRMPSVIVSASGMATGGRILHHLKHFAGDFRNTILFTGFQAAGTRGRALVDGKKTLKIHGMEIPVRATVRNLDALSAHADKEGLLGWLSGISQAPKTVFVTHGEPQASESLARSIRRIYGWLSTVPQHGQTVELN